MNDTINSVRGRDGQPVGYPEFVPMLSPGELKRIGEVYTSRLAKRAPDAERVTDKMPSNFYFVGLIHLALPGAKIVHTQRSPVDSCSPASRTRHTISPNSAAITAPTTHS
jgi:hypothetical protein